MRKYGILGVSLILLGWLVATSLIISGDTFQLLLGSTLAIFVVVGAGPLARWAANKDYPIKPLTSDKNQNTI